MGNRFGNIVFLVAHRAQGQAIGKLRGIAGRGIVPNLAGDYKHRDRIQPAANHAGQGVGAAGAGGNAQGGNFVINAGVCFRRNGACLLVMIIGNVQRRVMPQSIIQVHCTAAYHAEHIRNAMRRKKISHIIGQTLFHFNFAPFRPTPYFLSLLILLVTRETHSFISGFLSNSKPPPYKSTQITI